MEQRTFDFNNVEVTFENMLFLKLFMDNNFRNSVMPMLKQEYLDPPNCEYSYSVIFKYFNEFHNDGQIDINPAQVFQAIRDKEKFITPEDVDIVKGTFKEIGRMYDDNDLGPVNSVSREYLIQETEKFAKESAIYLALMASVDVLENKPDEMLSIQEIMNESFSVSVDRHIGLDYNNEARKRFESYHLQEDKIPFRLEALNKITNNGFSRKTLNCIMAGTGIGKTLWMTSLVTDYIQSGNNVLYVTLEIAENKIALRNDANLMNIPIGDFGRYENGQPLHSVDSLCAKFEEIKNNKKLGKLKIKEYPTGSITVLQIRALLKEMALVDGFVPDVIVVDYINLMNSSRLSGKTANSYSVVKAVAEELRGLAVEFNCAVLTATQTNRTGISGNEVDLTSVAESSGLPATVDYFAGIYQSEQQRADGIVILKVLKNRYAGYVNYKVAMGVDYNYMKIHTLEDDGDALDEDNSDADMDGKASETVFKRSRRR